MLNTLLFLQCTVLLMPLQYNSLPEQPHPSLKNIDIPIDTIGHAQGIGNKMIVLYTPCPFLWFLINFLRRHNIIVFLTAVRTLARAVARYEGSLL